MKEVGDRSPVPSAALMSTGKNRKRFDRELGLCNMLYLRMMGLNGIAWCRAFPEFKSFDDYENPHLIRIAEKKLSFWNWELPIISVEAGCSGSVPAVVRSVRICLFSPLKLEKTVIFTDDAGHRRLLRRISYSGKKESTTESVIDGTRKYQNFVSSLNFSSVFDNQFLLNQNFSYLMTCRKIQRIFLKPTHHTILLRCQFATMLQVQSTTGGAFVCKRIFSNKTSIVINVHKEKTRRPLISIRVELQWQQSKSTGRQ